MTPNNRHEAYLAAIAGDPVQYPEKPLTREEAYLDRIAKNSGGSSLPAGGTAGQLLTKKTNADGDAEWKTLLPSNIGEHGVAELDETGRVPSSHLPSYVDDVIEGYLHDGKWYSDDQYTEEVPGESGKIYVDLETNKEYRWSGTQFVEISESLALGETSSTAYRGDRGKTAYDFSQDPYTSTPNADGTGSAGSSSKWSRGDHTHPTDSTRQPKTLATPVTVDGTQYTTVETAIGGLNTKKANASAVGTLANLATIVKSNLVGAINEVNAKALDAGIILKSVKPQIVNKPIVEVASMGSVASVGTCIWTDGKDVYYSNGNDQKVLNKSNLTWENMSWGGYSAVDGRDVWTDGENIYHSNEDYNNRQHVLNKNTHTWNNMTWNGMTVFSGKYVWTDGTNIYFSKNNTQKVLDKSTSTWSDIEWQDESGNVLKLNGEQMWTDGENMYYSYFNKHYVFNKTTSKWDAKTWNGLTNFYGKNIWTDGTDIYYSGASSTNQYILDKSTSTWTQKSRGGNENFYGESVWTDGRNIYHSNTKTYLIKELSPNPVPKAK